MGRQLTLELPDELYEPLAKSAEAVGQTLDEWVIARLRPLAQRPVLSEKEKEAAIAELMAFAGCVNSGDQKSADNERIDVDLAREYGKELQMSNIEDVVDKLVKEYFDIEEGIKSIVWINPNQGKEIWLIEVDTTAIPAGRVEPFYFKPNEEVPYPVRIANITPDEWKAVQSGTIDMPEGWKLDGAERVFTRAEQKRPVRRTS